MPDHGAAQRPRHEADGEDAVGPQKLRQRVLGGKEGPADRGTEIAEDHEVVLFHEVAAGHEEHGADLGSSFGWRQHLAFPRARRCDRPGGDRRRTRAASLASVAAASEVPRAQIR